jgi:hypothetical protein
VRLTLGVDHPLWLQSGVPQGNVMGNEKWKAIIIIRGVNYRSRRRTNSHSNHLIHLLLSRQGTLHEEGIRYRDGGGARLTVRMQLQPNRAGSR